MASKHSSADIAVQPKMTKGERESLEKLVRNNARIAKADAEARGQVLKAHVEGQLAAQFKADDECWEDLTTNADELIAKADAELAERCRVRGISDDFRPRLVSRWYSRGENACPKRRAELRKLAYARVDALVDTAKVEVDREVGRQLTQLLRDGMLSPESRAFLGNMPLPEDLLMLPTVRINADGKTLLLESSVTPADNHNAVTVSCNTAVTADAPDCNKCAVCCKALCSGKGAYCSNACRQAAYRQRQTSHVGDMTVT